MRLFGCGCVHTTRLLSPRHTDVDFELERVGKVVRRVGGEPLGCVRLVSGQEVEVASVQLDSYNSRLVYLKGSSGAVVGSVQTNPPLLQMLGWDPVAPRRPVACVRDARNHLKLPYGERIERALAMASK